MTDEKEILLQQEMSRLLQSLDRGAVRIVMDDTRPGVCIVARDLQIASELVLLITRMMQSHPQANVATRGLDLPAAKPN